MEVMFVYENSTIISTTKKQRKRYLRSKILGGFNINWLNQLISLIEESTYV